MPIVKKLSRVCSRCGELFKPSGKFNKICDKCNVKMANVSSISSLSLKKGKKHLNKKNTKN